MDAFAKKLEHATKLAALLFVCAYGLGFLIWNTYLGQYGFFEGDFLQTRFLSSGILFLFVAFIPAILLALLCKFLFSRKRLKYAAPFVISFSSLLLYFIFALLIFPRLPQFLGGARPFTKSIIAEPAEIAFLRNFGIQSQENAEGKDPVQTDLMCEIYSNADTVIIGTPIVTEGSMMRNIRALILDKKNFRGFQSVTPSLESLARESRCAPYLFYR